MAIYHITYITENYYTKPVRHAYIEFMVLPENNTSQRCLSFVIQNSLEIQPQFTTSLYGANLIRFNIPNRFCSFNVSVNATVEKNTVTEYQGNGLHPDDQNKILNEEHFRIDNFRYLSSNEFTSPQKERLPQEAMRFPGEDLFPYIRRVNHWIHNFIKYQAGVTTTRTTLDEILTIRAGVCQDQAHLFIALLRANNVPARYVSGYLNQGKSFTGSLAMHAWTEAFLPGSGWVGFDPTNDRLSDINYIKVSNGLDYTDCMPIKGIFIAKGDGFTDYKVQIVEQ